MQISRGEWAVLWVTLAYIGLFTVWFLSIGNYEFVIYIATMLFFVALVGLNLRKAGFPLAMLWALSGWGFLHMAGGGVPVGDGVLYGVMILPIMGDGHELTLLKFDQFVHAYGFGVAAWVLHHLLLRHFPGTRGTATAYVYPALASMGLGAVNEMIEFTAVLATPETGVGGYFNTLLDLVFNAIGAAIAMFLCARANRRAG